MLGGKTRLIWIRWRTSSRLKFVRPFSWPKRQENPTENSSQTENFMIRQEKQDGISFQCHRGNYGTRLFRDRTVTWPHTRPRLLWSRGKGKVARFIIVFFFLRISSHGTPWWSFYTFSRLHPFRYRQWHNWWEIFFASSYLTVSSLNQEYKRLLKCKDLFLSQISIMRYEIPIY